MVTSISHLTLYILVELPGLFSRYLFAFIEWCLVAVVTLCHLCFVGVPVYFCVRDAIFSRLLSVAECEISGSQSGVAEYSSLLIIFTRRHGVTSQKTWIFNSGSVRLAPSRCVHRRVTVYVCFLSPWTRASKITIGFPYSAVMNLNYALRLKSTCREGNQSRHWNHHLNSKCCYLSNDVRDVV
jgi:hypothetical protein